MKPLSYALFTEAGTSLPFVGVSQTLKIIPRLALLQNEGIDLFVGCQKKIGEFILHRGWTERTVKRHKL